DLKELDLIILRQPKIKEEILSGCWGRLAFSVEINGNQGPAIFLEATNVRKPIRWIKNLSPNMQAELERLYLDGHKITIGRKYINIDLSIDSVRCTQLYRTLPHEIGHWVDYQLSVKEQAEKSQNYSAYLYYWELYKQKPSSEKEVFAHKYADS